MNAAISTKVVALGAVGSIVAQQALVGVSKLRECIPTLEFRYPAVADVAEAAVEAAVEVGEVIEAVPRDWKLATAFGLGACAACAALATYNRVSKRYPRRGGRWLKGGYSPETRVEGSEEQNILEPRFAARIAYRKSGGEYVMTGWGYRTDYNGESYLTTAQHCLTSESDTMYLRKGDKFFPIDISGALLIGNDAALIPVPENVFSRLMIRKPILGIVPTQGQAVSVIGLEGKGTIGLLTNETRRGYYGRVIYRGTTVGGYSGSPYYSGNIVYGMHTNGGHYNGGINAMYLHCKAKIATDDMTEEESPRLLDEWMEESDEPPIEWEGDWGIIQMQSGKYVRVSKQQVDDAISRYANKREDQDRRDREEEERRYEEEYESASVIVPPPPVQPANTNVVVSIPTVASSSLASGNELVPGNTRGGQESEQRRPSEPVSRQALTPESRSPLKRSTRSQVRRELRSCDKRIVRLRNTLSRMDQSASTRPSTSIQSEGRQRC